MIQDPTERFHRIGNLIESFAKADVLADWNIKVSENFAQVKAKQLFHVKLFDPKTNNNRDW